MNAPESRIEIPATVGTALDGGFYAGRIRIAGQLYALIVAPKSEGDHEDTIWIKGNKAIPGAQSYNDGLANTKVMAEAGSKLAKWTRDLRIGGHDDWYLSSQDELEIIYRNLKPTTRENYCWARSGINLSAAEPTWPYTPDFPKQTQVKVFQAGGEQAFEPGWYWSSTQHAATSYCAWVQDFDNGYQSYYSAAAELRARAVRRVAI